MSLSIGAGGAGAGEDDDGVVVTADRLVDDRAGVLAEPGRLQPGAARLGVRVRVAGQHLVPDEVLHERQRRGRSRCSPRTSPAGRRTGRASPGRPR